MHRALLPAVLACSLVTVVSFPAQTSLSEDHRVAMVADRQGTALVRPVGRERWSPIGPRTVLMPGDQVRTPARGANAAELRLAGGGEAVLGPGGLIELPEVGAVRLYRGELEVKGTAKRAVVVTGPGKFRQGVGDTAVVFRGGGQATRTLPAAPRWLTGYRASTTDEWMGSLIASVDGRNVPLSVGYHKVTVEIRDQIARTTIEQSFVNSTKGTLEGVFYFPLPADASISGFGMWIGGELVEADIVEKQKARRIYEDILRRKKDPGLLEWSGGNLFKARVFPILPHSEKRIRIRYTQVLPLEGTRLRYRYGLKSELLRTRPLRELRINVVVDSAMPIKSVASPTHEVRIRHTKHAASAEFAADEYTPDRDFELAVDLDRSQALTLIPHRRDEDGYFMLLLSPPDAAAAGWQRDVLPEQGPLDVVVVADTSGSMDAGARAAQAEFIGALLAQLGAKDTFRLLACDVNARWFKEQPAPVAEADVDAALAFLEARPSLGWTDLARALGEALERSGPNTQLIYVGDGIGTTGDADPVALAGRLRALARKSRVTGHAVAVSSTFEKGVLGAIAAIGGGSVRELGPDPAESAFRLLKEVAEPAIRDLEVSFEGLRTARIYPEKLPNLAAGTQHVILGRFLPTGGRQTGRVVVTGMRDGQPVRYAADVVIREGETGNSFTPRLWARRHIDALLAEGRSPAIQEEIVRFSEEFGIMTPFTSFLVLESDEDRERYGVQRRVKMRDGEQFFAEGRDAASTALLRQQMKAARAWRLNLRKRMLREIADLGEHLIPATVAWAEVHRRYGDLNAVYAVGQAQTAGGRPYSGPTGSITPSTRSSWSAGKKGAFRNGLEAGAAPPAPSDEGRGRSEELDLGDDQEALEEDSLDEIVEEEKQEAEAPAAEPAQERSLRRFGRRPLNRAAKPSPVEADGYFGYVPDRSGFREDLARDYRGGLRRPSTPSFGSWRFPSLPPAPKPFPDLSDPPKWTAEVLALVRSLNRREGLSALEGGVSLEQRGGSLHPPTGRVLNHTWATGLFGKKGWFLRTGGRGYHEPIDRWLAEGTRGVLAAGLRLGRKREAAATDRSAWGFPLHDTSLSDLVRTYHKFSAKLDGDAGRDDRVVLVLTAPTPAKSAVRITVDRVRRTVVEIAYSHQGEVTHGIRFSEFVEAGGMWWATRIATVDKKGRETGRYTLAVRALSPQAFADALGTAVSGHEDVIFLGPKDPDLAEAKQAVHENRGRFADHFRLAIHFAASGQWDKAWKAWNAAEAKAAGKPGAVWLRAALLQQSRKGGELKRLLTRLARQVAATDELATDFLAGHSLALASRVFQANEQLELLDALRPAFAREGEARAWRWTEHRRRRAALLVSVGRAQEAREIYAAVLRDRPFDVQAVTELVNALRNAGHLDDAVRLLEEKLGEPEKWTEPEINQLYERVTTLLWERHDLKKLAVHLERWITMDSDREASYVRYLSVLLFQDRIEVADAWVAALLARPIASPTTPEFRARLGAAIQFALGHGWHLYANRIEEKWLEPLADLARRLLATDDPVWSHVSRITGDWRFRRTDAFATLKKGLLEDLNAPGAIESMDLGHLTHYLAQLPWGRNQVDAAVWRRTVDRLRARWEKTTEKHPRGTLAGQILQLLDAHGERDEAIAFVRLRLENAEPDERPALAGLLLNRLFRLDWTEAIEDEIFALVPALQPVKAEDVFRRRVAASAVRKIAGALYGMRYRHLLGPAKEHEKLSRQALKRRKRLARTEAREGLIRRFAAARDAATWGKPWYEIERLGFAARLGRDLKETVADVREVFFSIPASSKAILDRLRRERLATVLAYLATRRKAPDGLADRTVVLFKKLESEAAGAGTDPESKKTPAGEIDWRYHLFRLLVALDRPAALAPLLEQWVEPAKVESRWRVAHGYLLAETGRLADAAAAFEAVARIDELGAEEYRALADWYLVLGDDSRREHALFMRHKVSPEHQLSNQLYQGHRKISRRGSGVPEELDPDTLRVMRALLSKASHPANYLWQIQNYYRTVKDFRLLESLADGLTGHTPAGVYPFLARVGQVVGQVHEEATCDTLSARIRSLAGKAASDLDRRALLLLTALVERRAAEVLNAPGPHARRGLEAMRAAFDQGKWLAGEPRLMAQFLASLGRISQPSFAAEQMRELRSLYFRPDSAPADRLAIARHLFTTEWKYQRYPVAIDGLTAALDEYRKVQGGVLPNPSGDGLAILIGWLENRRRFNRADSLLTAELERHRVRSHRNWLRQRRFQVWVNALRHGGAVSLGRGAALYREAGKRMEASMWKHGADQFASTVSTFCSLHDVAGKHAGIERAGPDIERFAADTLPELLTLAHTNRASLVSTVANTVRELRGPLAGLRVIIDRMEAEPRWLARVGQDGWNHHAWYLGKWRSEARALGDLEPRLLALVLAEIERDLLGLQARNRSIYQINNRYFWAAKKDRFAAVASRVIELNPDSPARLLYASQYLWGGLRLRDRAIGVLLEAESRGRLRETGRWTLVGWLHHERRFAESLPLIEKLTGARPDRLEYRVAKIRALHNTGGDPAAKAYLDATVQRFKSIKQWHERAIAALAEIARQCTFHTRSITLYEEVIPLHQRTHRNRGVGGGTLSNYYGRLAEAYIALGRADQAVDAASAAVMAWGRTNNNRARALRALRRVIERIRDLDGYVRGLDTKVKETGLDAPVVRKTIGLVYLDRRQPGRAIVQLGLARDLQPNDPEVHQALVTAHDRAGDPKGAVAALFAAVKLVPMNLDLYPDLGERLVRLGKPGEAERAWTTLAEVTPNEAAGHRRLAEHRERQRRYRDAVDQWRQVVRCRAEEPDGWIRLARSQIRSGDPGGARKTVDHLMTHKWEERFGDVKAQAGRLLQEVEPR